MTWMRVMIVLGGLGLGVLRSVNAVEIKRFLMNDCPVRGILKGFGIDIGDGQNVEPDDVVFKCISALQPDTEYLRQCPTLGLETNLESNDILKTWEGLVKAVVPTETLINEGGGLDIGSSMLQLITMEEDDYNEICVSINEMMPCLKAVFESVDRWISEAGSDCHQFTDLIVPGNTTWAKFLDHMFSSMHQLVCDQDIICSYDDDANPPLKRRCGYHIIKSLLLHVMKEGNINLNALTDFISIPDSAQACQAFQGKTFLTTNGGTSQLFPFGCKCAEHATKVAGLIESIPMLQQTFSQYIDEDMECPGYEIVDNNVEGICYNFPANVTSCECGPLPTCTSIPSSNRSWLGDEKTDTELGLLPTKNINKKADKTEQIGEDSSFSGSVSVFTGCEFLVFHFTLFFFWAIALVL